MTSVVIHIGQPKAASTSIQQQLWAHRETLAGADILYRPGQREQHGPEVLDLYFLSGRRPPGDAADRSVGGWDRLRREVRSAPRAIISAEMLSLCDAALAQRVVEDLSPCGRPRVLLCVRRPSAAVASAYSQLARVSLTVSFETWARLILAPEHRLPTRIPQLRNPDLVSVWEPFGDVVQVPLEHGDGAGFDAAVIEALGLSGIDLPRPFLQRHNTSPSAASVVAWQRLWRQGTPPLKFSRMPTVRNAISGGRFALVPDVADLVDQAFPVAINDAAERRRAQRDLARRLSDVAPITTVGVEPDAFEEAVDVCLAEYRRFLTCGS